MDKRYVNESEEVKQAYSFGTEVGHCSYISYLETELTKARSAMCEANSNAVLSEVRAIQRYEFDSYGIREYYEDGDYIKFEDVIKVLSDHFR
jgi:hypothetical protein